MSEMSELSAAGGASKALHPRARMREERRAKALELAGRSGGVTDEELCEALDTNKLGEVAKVLQRFKKEKRLAEGGERAGRRIYLLTGTAREERVVESAKPRGRPRKSGAVPSGSDGVAVLDGESRRRGSKNSAERMAALLEAIAALLRGEG